jgi:hypothetical protein
MHNDTGESDETVPNDPGPSTSTAVAVSQGFKRTDLLAKALGGGEQANAPSGTHSDVPSQVRRVKRGKFFLSTVDQEKHGSLRFPIFQHWGFGVVVGQMDYDSTLNGHWCYGAHNDFDLIPDLTALGEWPEYERVEERRGWVRKDGTKKLEDVQRTDRLLNKLSEVKRLT